MKKKYKIAIVTYTLSGGGLERTVANASIMFQNLGWEVHLFVIDSKIDYKYEGTLHVFNADKKRAASRLLTYINICRSINKLNFDLIIDHRYRLNPLMEFIWQRVFYRRKKVINYIHHVELARYLSTVSSFNRLIFGKRLFICVSKGVQAEMLAKFPFFNTKTIYNPVIVPDMVASNTAEKPFIVAIARMETDSIKQVDVMLECFSSSKLPRLGFKLILIGDGPERCKMEQLARNLKIEEHVVFKGFVAAPYFYLKNAYFTVLTSKKEGFGMVLLESLLLGTPVVSYDCPSGPAEYIRHENNGLLVENQNKTAMTAALNRLASDREFYLHLKANARESVERFSVKNIACEWKNLIGDF